MHDTAYILGSGPSILNLTDEEKAFLNAHPYTLAMNKYLMFWERVGVLPKDLFLADTLLDGIIVFAETMRRAKELIPETTYYIQQKYINQFYSSNFKGLIKRVAYRLKMLIYHRCWIPLNPIMLQPFSLTICEEPAHCRQRWGNSITDGLIHYKGSLTTAINLATNIYPVKTIKLIGVDLYVYSPFYGSEFDAYIVRHRLKAPNDASEMHEKARSMNLHATAVPHGNLNSVIPAVTIIHEHLRTKGVNLVCCNPDSLLVQENACPYGSIQ